MNRENGWTVITVKKLNEDKFVINAELIKFIEPTPDTLITLVNNEKILVADSVDSVVDKCIEYRRRIVGGDCLQEQVQE
ncbi:flagellar FlbD family protein [Candidatus Hydrogenedentota bacterium]